MLHRSRLLWLVPAAALCLLCSGSATAQELSPRSFWPAPGGSRILILGYAHSVGDVLMDPSIPLNGLDSEINTGILGYMQTFGLWGRTANVVVETPYSWGTSTGLLDETLKRRDFSGFNDPAITLTVNLIGAPAMTPAEFQGLRANPRPLLGVSVKLVPPLGNYDENLLINVGANRWAMKAELGSVIPVKPNWLLELEAGAWFFGDDPDYVMGRREQDPIWAAEAHLVRRFRPGFWASLEFNYFTGGQQTIGSNELIDLRSNSRLGGTIVVPFRGRYAVKIGYSTGARTSYGADFDQFLVTFQTRLP